MKILVITQNDYFSIPKNIKKLIDAQKEIVGVTIVKNDHALQNNKLQFIKWFGLYSVGKLSSIMIINKLIEHLRILLRLNPLKRYFSIKTLCSIYKIPLYITKNVNSESFLNKVIELKPDIIISYSAPQVFKNKLLKIPPKGCINLHCSLIPHYRGVLPSFWVLRNNESYTGVTIHKMADGIDDGDILGQEKVNIKNLTTMFRVIKKTKEIGGDLMLKVLANIEQGNIKIKENNTDEGSYYSWPSPEDIKEFHKNGFKLA